MKNLNFMLLKHFILFITLRHSSLSESSLIKSCNVKMTSLKMRAAQTMILVRISRRNCFALAIRIARVALSLKTTLLKEFIPRNMMIYQAKI